MVYTDRPTPRQLDCLRAIADYEKKNRRAPTTRELAALLGVRAQSDAHIHLIHLEELGALSIPRTGGKSGRRIAYFIEITPLGRAWLAQQKG